MPEKKRRKNTGTEPRRTITVSSRMTSAEVAVLDAIRGHTQRGAYLRELLLDRPEAHRPLKVIPVLNLEAYRELQKVGNNLNQIARQLNKTGRIQVEELRQEIAKFGLALIGAEKSLEDKK